MKGKKTHIVGILTFLIALTNFLYGDISLAELLSRPSTDSMLTLLAMGTGLGLSTLRAGVTKVEELLQ